MKSEKGWQNKAIKHTPKTGREQADRSHFDSGQIN